MRFSGLLIAASAVAAPAQSPQAPLEPTAKWVAEYADNMCLLQRSYGTEDRPLALAFRPSPMSEYFTGWVFDRNKQLNDGYSTARVNFGDQGPTSETNLATFFSSRLNLRISEFLIKREELERASRSGVISLTSKGHLAASFRVPQLGEALAVLDDCVADLLATWGFSRDQQKQVSQPSKLVEPMSTYISASDYPTQALREDESGQNSARFQVNADGKTSNCIIVESSHSRSLDSAICNVVRRFRYHPALDRNGQPMQTLDFVRIRWMLG